MLWLGDRKGIWPIKGIPATITVNLTSVISLS